MDLKGCNIKGEIFERAKHIVLNIVEYTLKIVLEIITIDELAIEIVWEALNLFGLYITLHIVKQILIITEYMPLEMRSGLLGLFGERAGQGMRRIGNLFVKGELHPRQFFLILHTSRAEINVLKSLKVVSKNDVLLYDNLRFEADYTSVPLTVPHITEALKSSYCC